ncbi:MAG: nucleotide exchange factor GrpE [Proteobacteria bacterium]|nr:nucleotide exchange factor GrpE [Pseudomonadota bacterium]
MEETDGQEVESKTKEKDEVQQEEHKKKKKKDAIIEELQKSLEEKEENIKILQDKLLYLQAEFENFKKLKIKEKQEILMFGNEVLIRQLLPVLDNLDRALEHVSKTEDFKSIEDGVGITLNEFLKVLEKSGVTRVDALGKKFDPNIHEALYQEERDDVEPDTIVSEFQKGYMLNGRLIRPSRVSVSKKPEIQ